MAHEVKVSRTFVWQKKKEKAETGPWSDLRDLVTTEGTHVDSHNLRS